MPTAYKRQSRAPGVLARGMTAAQYHKWHRAEFPERNKKRSADYYAKNKDSILAKRRARGFKATYEKRLEYRLRAEAKPSFRIARRAYVAKNKDRVLAYQRNYLAKKRATPRGAIDCRMSSSISNALRGRRTSRGWRRLVGYTVEELCRHIESRFEPGMTWEKLLAGRIEIDHAIPRTKFNYTSAADIDFKRCWALENLQPMWATENRSKSNKILRPTQIALGV